MSELLPDSRGVAYFFNKERCAQIAITEKRTNKMRCALQSKPGAAYFFIVLSERSRLLGGLGVADGLGQQGGDLEQVAADAVVRDLEHRRRVVFVHRDDALRILHPRLVLDRSGDIAQFFTL